MKKCCFIVPYYGKFPNYFQLFLHTCRWNCDFDWLIVTDIETPFDWPENVHRLDMTFDNLQKFVQSKFSFKISLEQPYKLCDFRPAYGYIFEKYLMDYKFWGHCDIDTVMGKISNFVTDEMLDTYDKIFALGHMVLYRNTHENNRFFLSDINGYYPYKDKLTTRRFCGFDEENSWNNINQVFLHNKKQVFMDDFSMNVKLMPSRFTRVKLVKSSLNGTFYDYYSETTKGAVCIWTNGKLIRYFIFRGSLVAEEFLYIHLQCRKMKCNVKISSTLNRFKIIPNVFAPIEVEDVTLDNFMQIKRSAPNIYFHYWRLVCTSKMKRLRKLFHKYKLM